MDIFLSCSERDRKLSLFIQIHKVSASLQHTMFKNIRCLSIIQGFFLCLSVKFYSYPHIGLTYFFLAFPRYCMILLLFRIDPFCSFVFRICYFCYIGELLNLHFICLFTWLVARRVSYLTLLSYQVWIFKNVFPYPSIVLANNNHYICRSTSLSKNKQ